MQSPRSPPGGRLLVRAARLAAPVAVGDEQRMVVEHRALDARPGAHVGADLLAHEAAEDEGRGGQDGDDDVGDWRRLNGQELAEQRRRVGEVEDPGAAGGDRDQQPDRVLDGRLRHSLSTDHGALSSLMRALRSPSTQRSTKMKRSVQTVCGQV